MTIAGRVITNHRSLKTFPRSLQPAATHFLVSTSSSARGVSRSGTERSVDSCNLLFLFSNDSIRWTTFLSIDSKSSTMGMVTPGTHRFRHSRNAATRLRHLREEGTMLPMQLSIVLVPSRRRARPKTRNATVVGIIRYPNSSPNFVHSLVVSLTRSY